MLADMMLKGLGINKEAAVSNKMVQQLSQYLKGGNIGGFNKLFGNIAGKGKLTPAQVKQLSKHKVIIDGVDNIFDFKAEKFVPVKPPVVQPKVAPVVQPKVAPVVQPKVAPVVQPKVAPAVQPKVAPVVQSQTAAGNKGIGKKELDVAQESTNQFLGQKKIPEPVVDKTIEKELTTASKTDAVRKVMDAADDADAAITDAAIKDVPLRNKVVKEPQVNWTDKWTQQYDKDPLKTLALTGGGVYAGSRVLENVFGNKQAAADLEYIMKFKQHRGIL
jgi:hypothetical protein